MHTNTTVTTVTFDLIINSTDKDGDPRSPVLGPVGPLLIMIMMLQACRLNLES